MNTGHLVTEGLARAQPHQAVFNASYSDRTCWKKVSLFAERKAGNMFSPVRAERGKQVSWFSNEMGRREAALNCSSHWTEI